MSFSDFASVMRNAKDDVDALSKIEIEQSQKTRATAAAVNEAIRNHAPTAVVDRDVSPNAQAKCPRGEEQVKKCAREESDNNRNSHPDLAVRTDEALNKSLDGVTMDNLYLNNILFLRTNCISLIIAQASDLSRTRSELLPPKKKSNAVHMEPQCSDQGEPMMIQSRGSIENSCMKNN
ncbi:unnamed protein product, partial [Rotaria magnacalcarata]